ncbi:hypothetical protein T484DRAFT_2910257 [Baffinella frigidus]|nr:hypothetical protein T484DRAFT_2910257 [Cryptophyta sp. CCMP2293]
MASGPMDFDCCGGCRGKQSMLRSRASGGPAEHDGSQCGIGVVFRMDKNGELVVDSLVTGGPAWESSTDGGLRAMAACLEEGLQVSDVLVTVDGTNVYTWAVAQLAPLMIGPEGTTVRLGVQRSSINLWERWGAHEMMRSLTIDVQRKRFSPPPGGPFSNSRPPIFDARRGLGGEETVRTGKTPVTG